VDPALHPGREFILMRQFMVAFCSAKVRYGPLRSERKATTINSQPGRESEAVSDHVISCDISSNISNAFQLCVSCIEGMKTRVTVPVDTTMQIPEFALRAKLASVDMVPFVTPIRLQARQKRGVNLPV
jgi:hypothetical protein